MNTDNKPFENSKAAALDLLQKGRVIETPFRHTQVVELDNCIEAMVKYASGFCAQRGTFRLGDSVVSPALYNGKEVFKVIGIRATEIEIQGDFSGGTHNVTQSSWFPIDRLQSLEEREGNNG